MCIAGICICGYVYSRNAVDAIVILGKALLGSSMRLMNLVITIALISGLSEAIAINGSSSVLVRPFSKIIRNRTSAFFTLGLIMMIMSWLFWPSPAVAIVGTVLVPAAVSAGLSPLWCAVCMNIFGHGIALSSDLVIQGAPSLTASAAGSSSSQIISAFLVPWLMISSVTVGISYLLMITDKTYDRPAELSTSHVKAQPKCIICAGVILTAFIADILCMYLLRISGSDASELIGGTAVLVTILVCVIDCGLKGLSQAMDCIEHGFEYGIKVFTPVIVIGAFFFLGNQDFAGEVLGKNAPAIINDIGQFCVEHIHVTRFSTVLLESGTGMITALDGSGFSGLVLTGSMAHTLSGYAGIDCNLLASIGQLITIWTGGGTLIPWSIVPVAAVCHVEARQIAAKNLVPVLCGMSAMLIYIILI